MYPNFAELAGQSTWYRNATGVAEFTPWALPAMLTGRYPDRARAPSYTEYPDNLFSLFGRSYDVTAYETVSQLCPPRHCTPAAGTPQQSGLRGVAGDSARVLKQLLQPYDAAFDPGLFADQTGPREEPGSQSAEAAAAAFRFKQAGFNQPARFGDFLAGLQPGDRPALHFLHLLLPHQPWRYLPSGNEYNFTTFGGAFLSDRLPAPVVELAHRQHLLQVAYTDRLVGQVIDKLKAEGIWEKSLVVMGADHGQGWVPGGAQPRPRAAQRPRPPVGAPVRQGPGPGQRPGRRPQLGAGRPAPDRGRPGRRPGALEDGWNSQAGEPARTRTEKWWFDIPGRRQVRDGPTAGPRSSRARPTLSLGGLRGACPAWPVRPPPT